MPLPPPRAARFSALEEPLRQPISGVLRRIVSCLFDSWFGTAWEALTALMSLAACTVYVVITYLRHAHATLPVGRALASARV